MCTIWEYDGTSSVVPTAGPGSETVTRSVRGSRLAIAASMATLGPVVPGLR